MSNQSGSNVRTKNGRRKTDKAVFPVNINLFSGVLAGLFGFGIVSGAFYAGGKFNTVDRHEIAIEKITSKLDSVSTGMIAFIAVASQEKKINQQRLDDQREMLNEVGKALIQFNTTVRLLQGDINDIKQMEWEEERRSKRHSYNTNSYSQKKYAGVYK